MRILWLIVLGLIAGTASANDVLPPASDRFASDSVDETPDLQRHVLPLMSRLGCNGRACHGSFQGRGGFKLSLFGYDFAADHQALTEGDEPRANANDPTESLILQKPTLTIDHEGGERMKFGSWQYRLLHNWIADGAKPVDDDEPSRLDRLEVQPAEITFAKPGEPTQLRVIAHWSDGAREDVTPLCRYRVNDDGIAAVTEDGLVSMTGAGDTEIVVFYDNGVAPVPVLLPVSEQTGDKYPSVPTPTKIDELVVNKLRKLGVVPSELCTDVEYLRRVSLDVAGTLPTPVEVEAFLADSSPDKRAQKVEELLTRPGYVAWWTTKFCDMTGNAPNLLQEQQFAADQGRQWYEWIYRRVERNVPYDELVAGIVTAVSREPGQDYKEYCDEMTSYFRGREPADFAERDTMPYFWTRRQNNQPKDMAQRFAHSFLGVRLNCAECHKHPFDQWTKQDFDSFTKFFARVSYGVHPQDRKQRDEMRNQIGDAKVKDQKLVAAMVRDGETFPWNELFLAPPGAERRNRPNQADKKNKKEAERQKRREERLAQRSATARLLGGEEISLPADGDPRALLMEWMRRQDNPYFARALVNRVWANYFGRGIVDPPDDQSLANPPSNPELLDYLVKGFIEHKYDLKWLHRQITASRTYQLSWQPNSTNKLDSRNFSHAVPRRLPAEVAYDAMALATAAEDAVERLSNDRAERAIGMALANPRGRAQQNYMLAVFGKPPLTEACDCQRSSDPSLLQTLYLHNDPDLLRLIDRKDGWIASLLETERLLALAQKNADKPANQQHAAAEVQDKILELENRLAELERRGNKGRIKKVQAQLASLRGDRKKKQSQHSDLARAQELASRMSSLDRAQLIETAYLRTLNRRPTDAEFSRAQRHFDESPHTSLARSTRDLLWALLNSKEFILNH